MSTTSPKLDLVLPVQPDRFSTEQLKQNWEKIDAAPGTLICSSTTRPVGWGAPKVGRKIFETDTGLEWYWDGTVFKRLSSSGILRVSGGGFAIGERTTDFSTASTTFVRVQAITSVVVPAGNRPLQIIARWKRSSNSSANFVGAIYRSNVNATGPVIDSWFMAGDDPAGRTGDGSTWIGFERAGLAAGVYDYSFQIRSISGTSVVSGDATTPASIAVIEL